MDIETRRCKEAKTKEVSPRLHVPASACRSSAATRQAGWTLIELLITMTVLTILTVGVIPLVKTSVRRQREQRLREVLREMRAAIEEFHRDTVGSPCGGGAAVPQPPAGGAAGQPQGPNVYYVDPRSRVVITDCKIFEADNMDRYPPTLEILVEGVSVAPRTGGAAMLGSTPSSGINATDNTLTATKKKVYLRAIPVDPITGKAEWELRSSYDAKDATSWGGENVFDVRSKAEGTALNGEKYSDW